MTLLIPATGSKRINLAKRVKAGPVRRRSSRLLPGISEGEAE